MMNEYTVRTYEENGVTEYDICKVSIQGTV